MRRPSTLSAPRIERGCVVSTRTGMGVVVRSHGSRVVLVWIYKGPLPAHRADVHPSWLGTAQMKMRCGDVVRCVPIVMRARGLYSLRATVPITLLRRIDAAVARELAARQDEEACRQRPGGPSIPRSRYG